MSFFRKFVSRSTNLSPKCGFTLHGWGRRTHMTRHKAGASYKTMKQISTELMRILDIDFKFSTTFKDRTHLMQYLPKSQEELKPKTMKDSFDVATIPLSTDLELQNKYVSFMGDVRIGRLLEDVDMFGVWCCVKHLMHPKENDSPFPYIIVTILIDRIDMLKGKFKPTGDIQLWGHVCWVGRSSLEVVVWLEQKSDDGEWKQITKALLLMAARDPLNSGPGIVNRIVPETPQEEQMIREAEARRTKRKQMNTESIFRKQPTKEELSLIHSLFLKTIVEEDDVGGNRVLPPHSKWMSTASVDNLIFCHPEHRNMHNKIFGGFIIRQALELAWLTAYLYGLNPPRLTKVSNIRFLKPVDVGSLVKLNACPTYNEGEYLQVFVAAEVFTHSLAEGKNTNSFHFTYHLSKTCDNIYPVTYLEAMKFIEGRRHFHDEFSSSSLPTPFKPER